MTMPHSPRWPGVPLALLSAVLFGASTPLAKLLLGTVDPWLLAGLLYLGAGLGLAVVHWSRGALAAGAARGALAPSRSALARRRWSLSGGIVGPLLLMLGLARTAAAAASLLLNLEGLATMAIAWLVFRENVDRRLLLGAFAILAGAAAAVLAGRAAWRSTGARLLIAGACLPGASTTT